MWRSAVRAARGRRMGRGPDNAGRPQTNPQAEYMAVYAAAVATAARERGLVCDLQMTERGADLTLRRKEGAARAATFTFREGHVELAVGEYSWFDIDESEMADGLEPDDMTRCATLADKCLREDWSPVTLRRLFHRSVVGRQVDLGEGTYLQLAPDCSCVVTRSAY